jgi:serine/threonine protein kinase
MPLSAGTRLGPYELLAVAGAGGMGEVYKARDTRLDRTVAVKVLPRALAADPQFRQRFDREARTISALDHPHICALFDVGEADGEAYLVMPFLEGETLAERLARGRMPLDEALTIAGQIADALDKAHRQGIVHRDLKPGNVMLTRPGPARSGPPHAKLLDFGLAKPGGAVAATSGASMAATQEASITAQGTFLGTLQYMSPEQIEGRDADARSDIFAFGCVLYEMLTGKRAFAGKSAPSLIAAILEHDPEPIAAEQPVAPTALDHVVRRCLAKDPDDRWASARDVLLELRWIADRLHATDPAVPAVRSASGWRERALWAAVVVLLAAVALTWTTRERPPLVTSRVSIIPPDMPLLNYGGIGLIQTLALSPDGRYLAHITWVDSRPGALHVRALDRFESTPLEGTSGGVNPFFSPDSRWVGFTVGRTVKKVPRGGGSVVSLGDLPQTPTGQLVWLADNVIVAGAGPTLVAVPGDGGPPTTLLTSANGETEYGSLSAIGERRIVLVSERSKDASWDDGRITAYDMATGTQKVVVEKGYNPRHAAGSGHLVFARGGRLVGVRFDAASLSASGSPVAVLEDATFSPAWGLVHASFGGDGTLVYVPAAAAAARQMVWVSRTGLAQAAMPILRPFEHPRLSPSGDRIVVGMRPGTDLWVGDVARGTLERLTFSPLEDESPVWHPDGLRVAFAAGRGAGRQTLMKNADGSGDEVVLFDHGSAATYHQHLGAWSPDGRVLSFSFNDNVDWSIGTIRMTDKPTTDTFLKTAFSEQAAAFSPDGRWLAYASDETGRSEVYVRPFPGPGGKQQISADGGAEPLWSRDGREIFYRNGDRMMAASVTGAPALSVGVPRMLFQGSYARMPWGERNYDVAADGRFLMLTTGDQSTTELRVVLNWTEELKRLVP